MNRRSILLALPALAIFGAAQRTAADEGLLIGKWIVRCPKGHDDEVNNFTKNHDCTTCHARSVNGGKAMVVCPDNHASAVSGVTKKHTCPSCGKECRRA